MRIKQNPLIKALVVVMVVVPLYFLATNNSNNNDEEETKKEKNEPSGKPVETENEAIAALSGYLSTVEAEQNTIKNQLKGVVTKEDVEELLKQSREGGEQGGFDEEALVSRINQIVSEKTSALQKKILEMDSTSPSSVGDVDNEMPFSDAFDVNLGSQSDSQGKSEEIIWVYPVGYTPDEDGVVSGMLNGLPRFGMKADSFAGSVKEGAKSAKETLENELKPVPYATIHSDSSIHGATAITALIGRIEKKGKTHDPFRFQIVLSGDTLMANGHTVPEVANAIVSGTATGDRAFNCVRGRVTSITFNFADGRIYNQIGTYEKPLAEIGDKWGNPCVKGVLVDDIGKHIAAQGTISGLASIADTIAKNQQSITSAGNSQTVELTGSAGKLAGSSFASGGLNKTSEILADRFESYYEAIYVKPNEKVSLLFLQDITIDYIPTNRKVSYDNEFQTDIFSTLD